MSIIYLKLYLYINIYINQMSNLQSLIDNYKEKLNILKNNCLEIKNETDFKDLLKGIVIMFIKDIQLLYGKLLIKLPELKFSNSSNKISNLNLLLNSLESDGNILNIDCMDIIIKGYINYFYIKYRDYMINWDINKIKQIDVSNIEQVILDTAALENKITEVSEHLNLIPEVVLMMNNLKDKDIIKILYLLNNMNTIIDVYLLKKQSF